MSKQTEALFSVDRLRKAWAGRKPQAEAMPGTAGSSKADPSQAAVPGAVEVLAEVVCLVRQRFPEAKGRAFEPLLAALEEKVGLRFPKEPGRPVPDEERDALNSDIEGLLSRIENLAEAMDMARKREDPNAA